MDVRTKSYLAKKHAGLKESAFQSRSTYQDEFKTPSVLSTSRPRTRSTNSTSGAADPAQYNRLSHANSIPKVRRSLSLNSLSLQDPSPTPLTHSCPRTKVRFHDPHVTSQSPQVTSQIPHVIAQSCPAKQSQPRPVSPVILGAGSSYKHRPRSIATSQLSSHDHNIANYTGGSYTGSYRNSEPLSPEYDYRTSNIFQSQGLSQSGNSLHSLSQGSKSPGEEVKKWGSCSRLEYAESGYAGSGKGMYPLPTERTEGDGGPAVVTEPNYLSYPASQAPLNSNHNAFYRRHSATGSHHSSHSGSLTTDDIMVQQKSKIEEQSRVIDSLMNRVTEQDARMSDRALSEKAMSESLDSGIDTRSETGAMRPHFNTPPSTSAMRKAMNSTDSILMQEHRKEINRLKLHVSQLEADRGDGGMDLAKFEQEVTKLREERDEAVDGKNAISRRFARLQEYLSTLPTIQEYHTLKDQIKTLTDELEKASQDQKIKNKEPSVDSKQKDADIKKYQKKVTESRDKILKLEKENSILKSQSVNQNKQDLQKLETEKRKMDKTVETLKKEIAVLSEQKDSAKNLSGGYYEKYNNEREKNKIISSSLDKCTLELKELESAVDEKEGVCQDMSQEVARLSEEVAVLNEQLHEAEQKHALPSGEATSARNLLHGCQGAITDLSGVVQVCLTRSRGGEPNMQQLLGLNSSFSTPNPNDVSSFDEKLVELQQIQSDIEYLRTTVADMYAEEVGNNCGTQ